MSFCESPPSCVSILTDVAPSKRLFIYCCNYTEKQNREKKTERWSDVGPGVNEKHEIEGERTRETDEGERAKEEKRGADYFGFPV